MKKPALLTTSKLVALLLATAVVFPTNTSAVAGGLQVCEPSSSCEVGEFLFDDDYNPITGATCTITSKYPDASAFLTSQAMTGESDGWYGHTFTAPTTEGLYRTQVCCTSGSDFLCIDKGFEVREAADSVSIDNNAIAEAVWGYSNRTLSSFGTLTRDIWLSSTRTLTTLTVEESSTSTTDIASEDDLSDIQATVQENRLLLEELVNKPIIETTLEDDQADLGQKLDETRSISNQLYANTQYIRSKASSITAKWNSFTDDELINSLQDLAQVVGKPGDSKANSTMLGGVSWITKAWGWGSAESLEGEISTLASSIDSSILDITTRGRSTYAYNDVKSIVGKLDSIEDLVGDSTADTPDKTLFGKLREVTRLANALDQQNADLSDLLVEWEGSSEGERRDALNSISNKVSPLNRISQLEKYLTTADSSIVGKDLKNKAFAIGGVIESNKKVLANNSGQAVAFTWLELGSIVFKSVIINPSSLISQNAHLEYFLPPEIEEEHIKKQDQGVDVQYDVERDQWKVKGDFELEPNETITVAVSTEDIWEITPEHIASLQRQMEEYMKALEGTAYYAQAITLKADIDVALEKATALQAKAVTPEQRIRAYREAQVELDGVFGLVDQLKELVTQVSSDSSMLAYVGGAQTMSVWGIAIIIIASVVFLAIYMKTLHQKPRKTSPRGTDNVQKHKKHDKQDHPPFIFGQPNWRIFAGGALGLLIFGGLVSGITAYIVTKTVQTETANIADQIVDPAENVLSERDFKSDTEETIVDEDKDEDEETSFGGQDIVRIEVPEDSSLNVRSGPSLTAAIIFNLKFSTEAIRISEEDGFVEVVIHIGEEGEDKVEGFVHSDFVTYPIMENSDAENVFTSEK